MPLSLTSFGEGAPSGENLEYDRLFNDLLVLARPQEDRQIGELIVAGQAPDAAAVIAAAEAVLARSHDLRAAVLLAHAELRLNGYPGFAAATGYMRGCLEQFWETCHPQLDPDDDDPTMRCNAVLGLCDPATVLHAVRLAPLTRSATFGTFSLRDLAIADGEIEATPDMERVPDPATVTAAFRDTSPADLAALLTGTRGALGDVEAMNAVFDVRLPGRGPDLDPLLKLLRRAVVRLAAEAGEPEAVPTGSSPGAVEAPIEAEAPAGRAPTATGEIVSARDIEQAIDRILAYYAKHEPSSPVPIFLQRARSLVGADFMTIVSEIAPGGVDHVKLIGGLK